MPWTEWITPKRVLICAVAAVGLYFSRTVVTILFPFAVALFLAAVLEPIIDGLQNTINLPRARAVLLTLTATVILTLYLMVNVFTKLISELTDLANLLPQHQENVTRVVGQVLSQFEQFNESLPPLVRTNVQNTFEQLLQGVESLSRDLINRTLGILASLPVILVIATVIIAAAYFISKDKELLTGFFLRYAPEDWHPRINDIRQRIAIDLVGFIKGRLVMFLIASVIAAAGLMLLGTRYWLILALIIAALDNIPVAGPGIIFAPWAAVTALTGDIQRTVALSLLYLVIFAFRQLLEPKIMGASVGIHPLVMLLALYGGIVAFGVTGIFVGPIIAIIIKAIFGTNSLKRNIGPN